MAVETIGKNVGIDTAVWNSAQGERAGLELSAGANEFVNVIQAVGRPTNSGISYEKSAEMIQVANDDPSDYTNGITRDLVGSDVRAIARKNDTRCWATCFMVTVLKGIRAMISALEIDGDNRGAFEPNPDTPGSSYGIQWVGGVQPENQPLTAANYVERGTCGHHRVWVMREDAFIAGGDFMAILYAGTNTIKHAIGPDGIILDGRKVARIGLPDGAGNWHDFLILE